MATFKNINMSIEVWHKSPKGRWQFIFYGALIMMISTIGFTFYVPYHFNIKNWAQFLPIFGCLSTLISIPFIRKYRNYEMTNKQELENDNYLVKEKAAIAIHTGSGFSEFPYFFGFLHYLFSSKIIWLITLSVVSLVLLYLYKPKYDVKV